MSVTLVNIGFARSYFELQLLGLYRRLGVGRSLLCVSWGGDFGLSIDLLFFHVKKDKIDQLWENMDIEPPSSYGGTDD